MYGLPKSASLETYESTKSLDGLKNSVAVRPKKWTFQRALTPGHSDKPLPRNLSWFKGLQVTQTGEFLTTGNDCGVEMFRDQLTNEYSNVGLISALFLTISIPSIFICDSWDRDWKKAAYLFLMNMGSAILVLSVLMSVILLLAVHECNSGNELRRFMDKIGMFSATPVMSFYIGAIIFGAFGMPFYCYVTYYHGNWNFLLCVYCIGYGSATVVLVPALARIGQAVYYAKDGRYGCLVMSRPNVEEAFSCYLAELRSDMNLTEDHMECEFMTLEGFKEYLMMQCAVTGFAELTAQRITSIYEEKQNERLAVESNRVKPIAYTLKERSV